MNKKPKRWILTATTLAGAVLLAGCTAATDAQQSADPTEAAMEASSPSQAADEPAADAVPTELQGTWLLDAPREQLVDNLDDHGFGKWGDKMVKGEEWLPRVRVAMTILPDYYAIYWRLADGTWDEGWSGPARVERDTLTLHDDYFDVDDVLAWEVDGDKLHLEFRETTGDLIRGIPSEAYSRAYFSQPWVAGDCDASDLDAC
jgi:hypothetical protein